MYNNIGFVSQAEIKSLHSMYIQHVELHAYNIIIKNMQMKFYFNNVGHLKSWLTFSTFIATKQVCRKHVVILADFTFDFDFDFWNPPS